MTDPTNQPLDPISTLQSGIVMKQIAAVVGAACTAAYSICAVFDITLTTAKQTEIGEALTSLIILGLALWTIHSRVTKPCPPIVPKSQLNNGDTK